MLIQRPIMPRTLRRALLVAGLAVPTLTGISPAMAKNVPNLGFNQARFVGVVGPIQGGADTPTQITLQLGSLSTDIRINLKTILSAKSAEASVEGLLQGDYAIVNANKVRGSWVAKRVTFDVQPFYPLHQFLGTVIRETLDQRRVVVHVTATQRNVLMRISKNAEFETDGKASVVPLSLTRGQTVQVLGMKVPSGWNAFTINVRTNVARTQFPRAR